MKTDLAQVHNAISKLTTGINCDFESKEVLRRFKPTYHYWFWGLSRTTSWELREQPLTDEQLNAITKQCWMF